MTIRVPSILLVEDNRADVALVEHAFSEAGVAARFTRATDAPQAFRYLLMARVQPPDLIILDLNLPVIGGHSLLREFKAHPPWNAVPVIVFSTSDLDHDIVHAMELGAAEYLVKSGDLEGYLALARSAARHLSATAMPPRSAAAEEQPAWLAPYLLLDELTWPSDRMGNVAG
jgi:CheY-like chemotaxis protein